MGVRGNRRQEILRAFALMLETHPGSRITTAALAGQVGVSEAALYRHFPSKAKMLEGLIEFIEESLFSRISRILAEWSAMRVPAPELGSTAGANLLLSATEGRINQFVRSEFRAVPTAGWEEQWTALEVAVFR
jgi:AcrR family transcriptional regulator